MLTLVIVLKGLVEILLFCHVAQGILWVFAGATRDRNIVYKGFKIVNHPIWKATRVVTPRFIIDAHVGFVSLFLLAVIWFFLVLAKIHFVLQVSAPAR